MAKRTILSVPWDGRNWVGAKVPRDKGYGEVTEVILTILEDGLKTGSGNRNVMVFKLFTLLPEDWVVVVSQH